MTGFSLNNISNSCVTYSSENIRNYFRFGGSNFTLIHHNLRSFNSNFDEFSVFLEDFDNYIDAYIFSETWFSSNSCASISNFKSYTTLYVIMMPDMGEFLFIYVITINPTKFLPYLGVFPNMKSARYLYQSLKI